MRKKLRLAAEYMASPFFDPAVETMRHVEIGELPISEELKRELSEWDEAYQATFNEDDPSASDLLTEEEIQAHNRVGKELAEKIQSELKIEVEFWPLNDSE
jgi:hypothetical protein